MRALKVLLSMAIVVAFASTAMAGVNLTSVNITGAVTGTYTINSFTINSDGSLTLNVGSTAPGALALILSPTSLPTATQGVAYSQNLTMTGSLGTPPYSNYTCSGTGVAGLTATPTGTGCTISGTPTATGTFTVSCSIQDAAYNSASQQESFGVNPSSGGGGGGGGETLLPGTGVGMTIGQGVSIAPYGEMAYYFTLASGATSYVALSLTTRDWQTNQDIYASTSALPSCSSLPTGYNLPPKGMPWYNTTSSSNESIWMSQQFPPGTTMHVKVCNRSGVNGYFGLSWSSK